MNDANKTAITHRVTATAAAYLNGLGCKPVETEVPVRDGWLADLASYWYPTMTEAKRLQIDRRTIEILGIKEWDYESMPRVYGSGPFTVLVEVKTTPSDFKRDSKWKAGFPAHICFVAFPSGIIAMEDIPNGWYGLETSKEGISIRKVHRARMMPHPQHTGLVVDFIAAVGIRRDHRTRYAGMRAFVKAYHAKDWERKVRYSAAGLLDGLANWIQRKGAYRDCCFSELLQELGIKKLPGYCRKSVEYFEFLRAKEEGSQ